MNDIIVVVPPGTRVRYIENAHIDSAKAYIMDARFLDESERIFAPTDSMLAGVPVYDAERYTPDA